MYVNEHKDVVYTMIETRKLHDFFVSYWDTKYLYIWIEGDIFHEP